MKNDNYNIKFSEQLGKVTDVKKLLKQINNLKASITGNKTKKLSAAEKIMCEVMQGDYYRASSESYLSYLVIFYVRCHFLSYF
jgi:hypothetical protein